VSSKLLLAERREICKTQDTTISTPAHAAIFEVSMIVQDVANRLRNVRSKYEERCYLLLLGDAG
jgi:hypothetical protein